jgi:hypothetical protein
MRVLRHIRNMPTALTPALLSGILLALAHTLIPLGRFLVIL